MKREPMPLSPEVVLGETDFRGHRARFGLAGEDRLRHMWVLGKTGVGKSTLLSTLIEQDLADGRGFALLDPHGPLVDWVLAHVPRRRMHQVLVIDPADTIRPVAMNVFRAGRARPTDTGLLVSEIVSVFRSQWRDSWGPRLEHVLRHAILAVAEHPEATLELVYRVLIDASTRERVLTHVTSSSVRAFWEREFADYGTRLQAEATAPILNKLGAFLGDPKIRALLGRSRSRVDFGALMDEGAIVVADLRVGAVGEGASRLLGALVLSSLQLAAMRRAPGAPRFVVYADEFQRFASDSVAVTLSESRKYGVGLVLAHQYLAQLPEALRDAALGNVGTIAAFRVGAVDAEVLAAQLGPPIEPTDLQGLSRFRFATRVVAGGQELPPFIARALPPGMPEPNDVAQSSDVRAASRQRFG
jgi:hypothetical protein